MFPGGMLGAARKLKRYGVELKGGGGGGGGIDTAGGNIGGTAASGSVIRFDVLAYQFDELSLAIGGKGVAGSRNPFDPVNSPLQFSNAGLRPGGLGGPLNSSNPSGGGGQGGGSTGAWLYGELLGGAAGGPGAGGGSQNRDGGNAGEFGANPAAGPTDGSGQIGAVPSGNNGGTGGGGGVDADHLGGKGGDAGTDNGSRSGGGKSGASWTNPARTLTFSGTPTNLSAYGRGGRGGDAVTSYGYRVGDGEDGTNGGAVVTDYETGQSYVITSSQGFALP